jgi:transcriptional regulator with XRE-family HTH domain
MDDASSTHLPSWNADPAAGAGGLLRNVRLLLEHRPVDVGPQLLPRDLLAGQSLDNEAALERDLALADDPLAHGRRADAESLGERDRAANDVARALNGRGVHGGDYKALPNGRQQAFPYPVHSADIQAVPKSPNVPALAQKLREAIRMRGVSQADVARAFGVKPPTVSKDWLQYGRIAKKHLPRLIEYFELPFEWWFSEIGTPGPTLFRCRRENLQRVLAEQYDGQRTKAAKEFGLAGALQLAAYDRGALQIEGELARRIETAAGRPPGWLDVPHGKGDDQAGRSIDRRVAALPAALRSYILGEIELCEAVADRVPAEFTKAPTTENVRSFQEYLRSLLQQPKRRTG